jgi:hypothetical protein
MDQSGAVEVALLSRDLDLDGEGERPEAACWERRVERGVEAVRRAMLGWGEKVSEEKVGKTKTADE